MGPRRKFNSVQIQMAILIAAIVGIVFNSWLLFVIALAVWIGLAVNSRDIR